MAESMFPVTENQSVVEQEKGRSLYDIMNRIIWNVQNEVKPEFVSIYSPEFTKYSDSTVNALMNVRYKGRSEFSIMIPLLYGFPAYMKIADGIFTKDSQNNFSCTIGGILQVIRHYYVNVAINEDQEINGMYLSLINKITSEKYKKTLLEKLKSKSYIIEYMWQKTVFSGMNKFLISGEARLTEPAYLMQMSPSIYEIASRRQIAEKEFKGKEEQRFRQEGRGPGRSPSPRRQRHRGYYRGGP